MRGLGDVFRFACRRGFGLGAPERSDIRADRQDLAHTPIRVEDRGFRQQHMAFGPVSGRGIILRDVGDRFASAQ